jgi:deazaflavin-dependent oxidoreductase (nitroreductase family)
VGLRLPKWLARVNKHVFNPREIRRGSRPVLTHVGRRSGVTYRAPLDAHPVDDGFVFFPMYGTDSDWVRNVLAAGSATLRFDGNDIELTTPRLLPRDEALPLLAPGTKLPPGIVRPDVLLRMTPVGAPPG